jgi:hypothetical protein
VTTWATVMCNVGREMAGTEGCRDWLTRAIRGATKRRQLQTSVETRQHVAFDNPYGLEPTRSTSLHPRTRSFAAATLRRAWLRLGLAPASPSTSL